MSVYGSDHWHEHMVQFIMSFVNLPPDNIEDPTYRQANVQLKTRDVKATVQRIVNDMEDVQWQVGEESCEYLFVDCENSFAARKNDVGDPWGTKNIDDLSRLVERGIRREHEVVIYVYKNEEKAPTQGQHSLHACDGMQQFKSCTGEFDDVILMAWALYLRTFMNKHVRVLTRDSFRWLHRYDENALSLWQGHIYLPKLVRPPDCGGLFITSRGLCYATIFGLIASMAFMPR